MKEQMKQFLFTGAYATAQENGIQMYHINSEAGGVLQLLDSVQGVTNPTFVHVDPSTLKLYAIGEKVNSEGVKEGEVVTFSIDPKAGKLRELNRISSMPAKGNKQTTTCHISRSPNSPYLVICSYHGGSVGLIQLDDKGQPIQLTDVAVHTGKGTHPERQDRPHPHSAIFSPDGKYVFVSDLGLDLIRAYTINSEQSTLVFHGDTALHPSAGPRHLVFHPDGHSAYVINEVDSTITSFTYDGNTGALHPVGTVSTLPADFQEDNTCAEIAISADGRYLYGSNRGHDSTVVFAVESETGALTFVEHVSTRGEHPRHFTLTIDGEFLVAANRDANNLVVFSIDKNSGRLVFTGNTADLSKPVCVKPALFSI